MQILITKKCILKIKLKIFLLLKSVKNYDKKHAKMKYLKAC